MANKHEQLLSAGKIQKLLMVSPRTFARMQDEGLPSHGVGRAKRFRWDECYPWVQSRQAALLAGPKGSALIAEQIRKTAAEASRIELKLSKERGELVGVQKIKAEITNACTNVRNRLLGLPRALAPRLRAEQSTAGVEMVLDQAIRTILELLAEHAADHNLPPDEPLTDPGAPVN